MLGLRTSRRRAASTVAAATVVLGTMLPLGPASADADDVLGAAPRVKVSTDSGAPVALEPGLWSDVLEPAPSNAHQFSYQRSVTASNVHISVIALAGGDDGVEISTRAGRVEDCGNASFTGDSSTGWEQVPVGTRVSVAKTDRSSECMLKTVPLQIEVQRSSSSTVGADLPIRIQVVEEAPLGNPNDAENGRLPEPPSSNETIVLPEAGDAETVTPGSGFDDAYELASGTVTATLRPGEAHFYRAPLDWGQTLAARADVDLLTPPDSEMSLYGGGPELALVVADPLRNTIDPNLAEIDATVRTEYEQPDQEVEPVVASTGFGPVTWLDRGSNRVAYLPGDHWLVVSVRDAEGERPDLPITYHLTMEVQGEAVAAPDYADESAGFQTAAGAWRPFASGQPGADKDEGWFSARRGAGLGLVAGGLVCLALGVLQVRRPRA